jgi:hypothetical protein
MRANYSQSSDGEYVTLIVGSSLLQTRDYTF